MDPTWGQQAVDATHIALVEGEIDSQHQLVKVLGKLSIEILEEHESRAANPVPGPGIAPGSGGQ